jgi:hypothetical protein
MTVAWFTIEDLGVLVRRHRVDDSVARAIARLLRTDLVIVDDIGLLPVSPDAAEGFYRLVDAAYERRSLAVSSNLHPSGFDEIMPKTLATATATATVDRLLHHAPVVVTQGDSFRLKMVRADGTGGGAGRWWTAARASMSQRRSVRSPRGATDRQRNPRRATGIISAGGGPSGRHLGRYRPGRARANSIGAATDTTR